MLFTCRSAMGTLPARWQVLRRRAGASVAALLTLAASTHQAVAARQTIYERMSRADLVVLVRTIEGSLRLAECQVLEVLKGEYSSDKVFIAFRSDNMNRTNYRDRIMFETGHQSVLLLYPARNETMELKAADRFRIVDGFAGKVDLPSEGAEAYVRAFRRMGQILELEDIHQIWEAHRALLRETNPYLVETGFSEILKFRLGDASLVPDLVDYLDSRHDRFRAASLDVLAQVFERSLRREEPLGNEDHVVARVLSIAVDDPVPEVRVAAIRTLRAYGRPAVVAALQGMANADPSQEVRYEASLSVYRLTRERPTAGAP